MLRFVHARVPMATVSALVPSHQLAAKLVLKGLSKDRKLLVGDCQS